jgi:adenylate kinase
MRSHLVLLGPPGAGKGTLGSRLSSALSVPLIVTGDLIRETADRSDALGATVKSFVESGRLVPDDLVTRIIAGPLHQSHIVSAGFILDGYPRTVPQAESLHSILEADGRSLDAVLYLEVGEETVLARLSLRRQCPICGALYHLRNLPPQKAGVCDRCGSALVQRSDDEPEVIRRRLSSYHQQTAPLIEYYSRRRLLTRINAALSPDEVFVAALSTINEPSAEAVGR